MKNKKIIIGVLIGLLLLSGIFLFISLNNKNKQKNVEIDNTAKEVLDSSSSNTDSKVLVAYFSVAGEVYNVGDVEIGNTAIMASYIKEYLNSDSFEIEPVKPYTTVYKDLIEVAKEEQKNNTRPEIKNKVNDFYKYDTILIGYPIWWGDLPTIVYTFLEEYDFTGKTIIPFNTHEGSGSSGTYNMVKNKLSNANVSTNGLALQGKIARTEEGKTKTISWLKELGY